jgi:2-keto-4-pentenoate hydratase/2-oxohepta-3-ene-1,7-dioic acid hydratase in catechol pathway
MRLASFRHGARRGFGVVDGAHLVDLSGECATLRDALTRFGIDGVAERARAASGPRLALAEIAWEPPITDSDKTNSVGLNYYEQANEANMAVPTRPSLFVRFPASQVGHDVAVVRPSASAQFDYEAELAVVVGRAARHVAEERANDYIAGYTCFAENSVRDWQRHAAQATPGKNFEASGAMGPWLVTPDESGPVENMTVIGRLNGREMQRDSAANMIFSVPQIIAYISTFATLLPGDVIVTGTPAGVGFTRKPPLYMVPGDVFEVEITGVGVLRNGVVDEDGANGART